MRFLVVAVVGVVALIGAACGQSEPGAPAQPAAAPAAPVHDGRAVEITANDTIKFSMTEITAAPGERLSVTLKNIGSMPKFSMGHNFLLLDPTTDVPAFLTAAATAPTTDYVPADLKAKVLAATSLLGPGESGTVTFNAPTSPGRYDFICSFPGHYQVGMKGVLIVKQ
jgi:azurin